MLEIVLDGLFGFVVIIKVAIVLDVRVYGLSVLVTRLQRKVLLNLVQVELLIDGFLDTLDGFVHKSLEVVMIEVKSFAIGCLFPDVVKAVVLLQMEDLLDKHQHLDQPVLTTFPLGEFILQPQFTGVRMHQWMENFGDENDLWHVLGIILREENLELNHCILVDPLLDKIGTDHSL